MVHVVGSTFVVYLALNMVGETRRRDIVRVIVGGRLVYVVEMVCTAMSVNGCRKVWRKGGVVGGVL
jgi:hypothetical protein